MTKVSNVHLASVDVHAGVICTIAKYRFFSKKDLCLVLLPMFSSDTRFK